MSGPRAALFFMKCRFSILLAALTAAIATGSLAADDNNAVAIEALSRLKEVDLDANPAIKSAVLRIIESTKGTAQFVELVRDFKLKGQDAALLDYALSHPSESAAADAVRLLMVNKSDSLIDKTLKSSDANKLIEPLGNTGERQIVPFLLPLLTDTSKDVALRQRVLRALAQVQDGAAEILKLAKNEKLPADLKLVASSELNNVRWASIKSEAAQLLPPPQSQNSEPLPPISELMKRTGDPQRGAELFQSPQVACASCHQVNSKGIDFGPKLSEIGTKLGKDALYAAILDPNAGISFGYETWQLELKNGDEGYGLIASETESEVAIKSAGGILTRYKKSDIAKREKLATSTMPSGLQQAMTTQQLVDLVEYLSTLKKVAE
ncbi:MAG: c-type cytochrome [Pedosphaera sp.]|nr:c-type cytochrome [Pedosphaera sp.]